MGLFGAADFDMVHIKRFFCKSGGFSEKWKLLPKKAGFIRT